MCGKDACYRVGVLHKFALITYNIIAVHRGMVCTNVHAAIK